MTMTSSVITHLVVLSSLPIAVHVSEPLVHSQVVQRNIGQHFLLYSRSITSRSNAVFESKSFELFVSVKAVLNRLRNLVSEGLDQID
jgi:hypothetical protein